MAYLCFANGINKDEIVKILEGEIYEIDRLTVKFDSSDKIREKYAKKLSEFKSKYPNAQNCSVRIFGDGIYSENGQRVLYRKHKVAFEQVINDETFLKWFAKYELEKARDITQYYRRILNGIVYRSNGIGKIKEYIATLKQFDKQSNSVSGGGSSFYHFMRRVLNVYMEYAKSNNVQTIDELWRSHSENNTNRSQPAHEFYEIGDMGSIHCSAQRAAEIVYMTPAEEDVDAMHYGEQPVYGETLYGFFTGDLFERNYSHYFAEESLMIAYDACSERAKWCGEEAEICYGGIIKIASMQEFTEEDSKFFNSASIVIFYATVDTSQLREKIIIALENRSEVILVSDNYNLIAAYDSGFKGIQTIFDGEDDNHLNARRQLIGYFENKYRLAGGYQKKCE